MEDGVDESERLTVYDKAEVAEAEENGTEKQESNGGGSGGLIDQIILHLPVFISGFSETSAQPVAGESSDGDGDDRDAAEVVKNVAEAEEKGPEKQQQHSESNGGGRSGRGLIEQIISHLPASIPGISEPSPEPFPGKSSGENGKGGEAKEATKVAEAERIPTLPISVPDATGPDPEEASILISIIHD